MLEKFYDVFVYIVSFLCICIVFKSVMIGSDFSFWKLYKYGKKYLDWYDHREDFNP